jgi:hypothetical protein
VYKLILKKSIHIPPQVYWEFIDSGCYMKRMAYRSSSLWRGDMDYVSLGGEEEWLRKAQRYRERVSNSWQLECHQNKPTLKYIQI